MQFVRPTIAIAVLVVASVLRGVRSEMALMSPVGPPHAIVGRPLQEQSEASRPRTDYCENTLQRSKRAAHHRSVAGTGISTTA